MMISLHLPYSCSKILWLLVVRYMSIADLFRVKQENKFYVPLHARLFPEERALRSSPVLCLT